MIEFKPYGCNHRLYNDCTLYFRDNLGLAVIQQRFNDYWKLTWWDAIDKRIAIEIQQNELFEEYFAEHAAEPENDIYPTVEVRKLMWALKMKTPKKQFWETRF